MWVKRDARRLSAVMVGLVLLVAPNAVADDSFVEQLLPPNDVRGTYDEVNNTLLLEWQAPTDDPVKYRIYRNAVLIAETNNTTYEAVLADYNVFHVTTWHEGTESVPSLPVFGPQSVNPPQASTRVMWSGPRTIILGGCEPVGTVIDPNEFPFVFVVIHEECIPPGSFIGESEPVTDLLWG